VFNNTRERKRERRYFCSFDASNWRKVVFIKPLWVLKRVVVVVVAEPPLPRLKRESTATTIKKK